MKQMNILDKVIKDFKKAIPLWEKDSWQKSYCEIILKYLILENKYKDIVLQSNKCIYYYFKYSHYNLTNKDYLDYLYNSYNPVRFAVETFDSIEEIKQELLKEKL